MRRLAALIGLLAAWAPAAALVKVDNSQRDFKANVEREITLMKEGKRGVVCQTLIERLEASSATTTIQPLTAEEATWHPNDRRGTRSHVAPLDTKVRGAERRQPTSAVLYLHPTRVDPKLSLYKLGTFVYELSTALDLNTGQFSGDYRIREKRAVFFRNAWCDAQGYNVIDISDRVPTPEYKAAKTQGLLVPENSDLFPIIETPPAAAPSP